MPVRSKAVKNFEELYNEYYKRVYAFLYKLCRDASLCEDMTQDTFFEAYKSLHKYNESCTMFTFLAAIAKNVYFKYLRKKKVGYIDIELLRDIPSDDHTPEAVCMRSYESRSLKNAVAKLPKKYRDVVILRTYADMPYSEIAVSMGITENSAKVIYHRAKKILKEELFNEYNLCNR